ncbi:YcbK family protein [Methyloterricola oryzae]|uniref:YcbK family protein n=1 Tax=Methyloterricola oryzae TaxID=1495050 RepID=UPI0005EAD4DC|nr:DUF882 domain-containing protein [Methyloterricola oryzae]
MKLHNLKHPQGRRGISRRGFLTRVGVAAAGTMLLPSTEAFAKAISRERRISLYNTHTQEELSFVCCPQENYDRRLLTRFNYFLRDHHSDQVRNMDPALLDLLYAVTVLTRGRGEFNIISGYRSAETNAMLRKVSHGVAEHSLHIQGKAIDLRTEDVSTRSLRTAALALEQGGVGYYRASDFIHMDTGDVRSW